MESTNRDINNSRDLTTKKYAEKLSIVAPLYNEKDNIELFVEKASAAAMKGFDNYEIVLVDDGSTDGSREVLDNVAAHDSHVVALHFTKNNGQTAALDAAFKAASGDYVLMMDSDLQTDPEDLYTLLPYMAEYDMANGMRATREDGIKRKLSSLVGNGVRNLVTGDDIKDTGCPLKLFKSKVVKSYYLYEGMHRFLPSLARINGYKVIEVPVSHFDRQFGVSKYGVFNRLFKGLKDAFAVRWMKKRMLHYEIEGK